MRHSLILLVISLFFIFGCAEDSTLVNPTSGSDDLQLISFQPNSLAKKSKSNDGVFTKKIKSKKGGTVEFEVEGNISIEGELVVPAKAFSEKKLEFVVDLSGEAGLIDFGPDGKKFDKGLEFSIKYVGIDFSGIDGANLKFAHILADGSLEIIDDAEIVANVEMGYLEANVVIWHFSRYAFVGK